MTGSHTGSRRCGAASAGFCFDVGNEIEAVWHAAAPYYQKFARIDNAVAVLLCQYCSSCS